MLKSFTLLLGCGLLCATIQSPGLAAERPTLQVTRDPRPDILPYHLYYAHTEYRRAYNRPRHLGGWIAYHISPTSQEAMVWSENLQAGNYDEKHMPPMYKRYCAPKPWEVLQTGPRPDYPKPSNPVSRPTAQPPSVLESAPLELGF